MKENIVSGFDFGALPIKIDYVGKVNDKDWPHFLWNVVISHKNGFWTVPYKTGLGLIDKPKPSKPWTTYLRGETPKKPTNSDIMYSILLDAAAGDQSFNDWCDDFGYDQDSMKAFKMYQACCEEGVNLKKTFTREQIEEMRTALEDY